MFAGLAVLRDELRRKQVLERERRRTNQHLKLLAETDSLTGLLNRRAAAEQAPGVIEAARQAGQPLGAILLDIDHFKTVNDVYGHAGGDAVLKRVAAVLTSLARPGDLVVRYGGEEFLVLAPGLDAAPLPIWPNGCVCASRPGRGIARPFQTLPAASAWPPTGRSPTAIGKPSSPAPTRPSTGPNASAGTAYAPTPPSRRASAGRCVNGREGPFRPPSEEDRPGAGAHLAEDGAGGGFDLLEHHVVAPEVGEVLEHAPGIVLL